MLKKYAELLVKQGVNLQKDQELIIDASVENVELVRLVTEEAYKVGAKDVVVMYSDQAIDRLRYENASLKHMSFVPKYIEEFRNEYAKRGAALLFITSEDPEGLKGIEPEKLSTRRIAVRKAVKPFHDAMDQAKIRWCIAGAPGEKWARKVFPQLDTKDAIVALWEAIFKVSYCEDKNPIEAWNEHRRSFERRVKILNEKKIQAVHYKNDLGTDLTLNLPKGYLFAGGGSYTQDGVYSFPNIPTEEIFASPQRTGTNGIVYSSMPLNYQGNIIDEFYLKFEDGRIVDYGAKKGCDILETIIETDEGSHYLGEIALVPYDSPIRNMDLLFYNTLYDENASCHLAIGTGFGECIENGLTMNEEELLEHGINVSLTHVDFMIGTKDLSIVATLEDGEEFTIFEEGNFAF